MDFVFGIWCLNCERKTCGNIYCSIKCLRDEHLKSEHLKSKAK